MAVGDVNGDGLIRRIDVTVTNGEDHDLHVRWFVDASGPTIWILDNGDLLATLDPEDCDDAAKLFVTGGNGDDKLTLVNLGDGVTDVVYDGGAGFDSLASESLSLNYTKIEFKYNELQLRQQLACRYLYGCDEERDVHGTGADHVQGHGGGYGVCAHGRGRRCDVDR